MIKIKLENTKNGIPNFAYINGSVITKFCRSSKHESFKFTHF